MKIFSILFFCGVFGPAFALDYLKLGKVHHILGDKVRVRAEANTGAKVLKELSIGSEITPVAQTTTLMTQDGVEAPWYKVSFMDAGKKTEGFVWGNLIAKASAKAKDGSIFLYGIGRGVKSDPTWTNYSSQVRVAKDGKELARLEIKEGVGFMSGEEISLRDGSGFEGVENIFSIRFVQEYCGGKGNALFVFWTGKKLHFVHSTVDGADAPVYAVEKQIFPTDKDGKKNHLFIVQEHGDHDNPKAKTVEKFWLKWTGSKLTKVP